MSSRHRRQERAFRDQERLSGILDRLQSDADDRHAWLFRAGAQAR